MKPAGPSHRIRRFEFDLHLASAGAQGRRGGEALQQRIAAFCREGLEQALAPCFEEAAPGATVLRIRRIDLDLGNIAAKELERQLPERLRHALADHLRRLGLPLRRPESVQPAPVLEPGEESSMPRWPELLAWLEHGQPVVELATLFAIALEAMPASLLHTLRRLGRREQTSRRLATALPEPALEQVVRLLEPGEADYIVVYARQLRRSQRVTPLVSANGEAFDDELWTFILHYLLVPRGSEFNRRTFVAATLQRIAQRYQVAYTTLLARLTRGIERLLTREGRNSGLLNTLIALGSQAQPEAGELAEEEDLPLHEALQLLTAEQRQFEALAAWLQGKADRYSVQEPWESVLHRLARRQPAELKLLLHRLLQSRHERRRLLRELSAGGRRQLWRWLAAPRAIARLQAALAAVLGRSALAGPLLELQLHEAVLAHWLAQPGESDPEPAAFAAGVLQQLAAVLAIPYSTLLQAASHGALQDRPNSRLHDLLDTLARQVADEFSEADRLAEQPATVPPIPPQTPAESEQTLLLRWLETGHWPWRAVRAVNPARLFGQWLTQAPAEWLEPLQRSVSANPAGLARMRRHLPAAMLERVLLSLQPALGGFILTWLNAGEELGSAATLSARQRRQSADAHWEAALALLLSAPGAVFSAAGFLAQASARAARALSLPLESYRHALRTVAQAKQAARYAVLADLLERSATDDVPLAADTPAEPQPYARSYRYRLVLAEAGNRRQLGAFAALQLLLRYGKPLGAADLAALYAVSAQLPTWAPARRRPWRTLLMQAAGVPLERQRLSGMLPPALLARLLPLWLPVPAAAELECLFAALSTGLPTAERRRSLRLAWEVLFEQLHQQRGRRWSSAHFVLALARRCDALLGLKPLRLLPVLEQALARASGSHAVNARQSVAAALVVARGEVLPRKTPPSAPALASPAGEDILPEGAPLYVGNAGLVLLWPFLTRYFEMFGLVKDGRFVDETARSRAVYLLQWLASGRHEAAESELILNKLLCGMPAAVAPEFVEPPSEEELSTGQGLLYAVTQRWEKLKHTSVDALRETFLLREGRLLLSEGKATLTVSQKAYDMLLDSLPWSYSMVKLPWMERMLFVTWR